MCSHKETSADQEHCISAIKSAGVFLKMLFRVLTVKVKVTKSNSKRDQNSPVQMSKVPDVLQRLHVFCRNLCRILFFPNERLAKVQLSTDRCSIQGVSALGQSILPTYIETVDSYEDPNFYTIELVYKRKITRAHVANRPSGKKEK